MKFLAWYTIILICILWWPSATWSKKSKEEQKINKIICGLTVPILIFALLYLIQH